jgi:Tol biopolymer transport system component
MPLTPGSTLGAYTVGPLIGSGGMGEVYQARDARLGRNVALKVLPESVRHDLERLARFRREAQALAALNHPRIGQIYGLEESDGTTALVLELVEGPTLADRVAHGPLPLQEAMAIAAQIAEALEAAHESGIVHRDLKPANIKLTMAGAVKVLDFGLAKIYADEGPARDGSLSPTITAAGTRAGVVLGTAAYMSPEQARGGTVDKRSDIWAFGCVLFEMLTGRSAFGAETVPDTVVRVLSREPELQELPGSTPPAVVALLKRCLQKDRHRRLRDIADARFQIEETQSGASPPEPAARPGRSRLALAGWIVAGLALAVAVALWSSRRQAPVEPLAMRLNLLTPGAADPVAFALSPDGRMLAYLSQADGQLRMALRTLEQEDARPLEGTERAARYAFWSPDSRSLAFFADGALKRIEIATGFVRTVTAAPNANNGAWNAEGTILFGASAGPLSRVSAQGGVAEPTTALLPGHSSHRWPQFLSDGRRFLFLAVGSRDTRGIYLGSLDTKEITRVVPAELPFAFVAPSHLLVANEGALWAQKLTADYTGIDGAMVPVAPRVFVHGVVTGLAGLSASPAGQIAYRPAAASRQVVWLDRNGRQIGTLIDPDATQWTRVSLSHDGRTIVAHRTVAGNTDLWAIDARQGSPRRLTFDAAIDGEPVLSSDGRRVVYASDPDDSLWDIYERAADGTGSATLLQDAPENENPRDWSADGRHVLYAKQSTKTDYDLWALPLDGDRKPFVLVETPFQEDNAKFSPDGKSFAFESNESGRREIYVQPFPGPGAKVQVSVSGGQIPRWRRDGKELYYIAPGGLLMAVPVGAGPAFSSGPPQALFPVPANEWYEPSPDGQRFLVNQLVSEAPPLTILLNWTPPGAER